jgi:hypothetical protein
MKKRKYKGLLAKPIMLPALPPKPGPGAIALFPNKEDDYEKLLHEWQLKARAVWLSELPDRVDQLFHHYGIDEKNLEGWQSLTFKLAFEHVEGFRCQIRKQSGRKIEWSITDEIRLLIDVEETKNRMSGSKSSRSDIAACKILAKNPSSQWYGYRPQTLRDQLINARKSQQGSAFPQWLSDPQFSQLLKGAFADVPVKKPSGKRK